MAKIIGESLIAAIGDNRSVASDEKWRKQWRKSAK
jgi:hypothetical protein